jgi:hypothetical protein
LLIELKRLMGRKRTNQLGVSGGGRECDSEERRETLKAFFKN